ncbi:MAG: hypothetical protein JKY42_01030 [Flavobacteriales bacterium]|nr:hypothetical protein [Flavobacteriales bacterium]
MKGSVELMPNVEADKDLVSLICSVVYSLMPAGIAILPCRAAIISFIDVIIVCGCAMTDGVVSNVIPIQLKNKYS